MKSISLAAISLFIAVPVAVQAEEVQPRAAEDLQRLEHEGLIYSYSVTKIGNQRLISGVEEKTGKRFKLRVGAMRVRGTVGSQPVSFPLSAVKPLQDRGRPIASR